MHKYRNAMKYPQAQRCKMYCNMYVNVESFSEKSLVLFEVMPFPRSFSQRPNLLLLLQGAPASARAARVSAVTVAWPTWGSKKFFTSRLRPFRTTTRKNMTINTNGCVKSSFVKENTIALSLHIPYTQILAAIEAWLGQLGKCPWCIIRSSPSKTLKPYETMPSSP